MTDDSTLLSRHLTELVLGICSQFTNETVQSQSLLDRRPERAILTVGTSLSYYTTKQKVIISNAIKVEISLKRINALMQFP